MAVWLRLHALNLRGLRSESQEITRDAPARQMIPNRSVYRNLGLESRATVRCVAGFPGLTAETFTVADLRFMLSMESGRSLPAHRVWAAESCDRARYDDVKIWQIWQIYLWARNRARPDYMR